MILSCIALCVIDYGPRLRMGRKKEFVASKSFTLGLQELLYMEKVCNEKKIKASKFINRSSGYL